MLLQIPIKDTIDLHGVSPQDVEAVLEEYLSGAHFAGLSALRNIWPGNWGLWRKSACKALTYQAFYGDEKYPGSHTGDSPPLSAVVGSAT